jgi:hypothetical protein
MQTSNVKPLAVLKNMANNLLILQQIENCLCFLLSWNLTYLRNGYILILISSTPSAKYAGAESINRC